MNTTASELDLQTRNRRAAWRWGSFVVGLLTLQVAGGITAIVLATGDESVAVIPNYHQKALNWDDEMARRAASTKLGWTTSIGTDPAGGLRLSLRDRDDRPVSIVSGTIQWYHFARAGEVRQHEVKDGFSGTIELFRCFDADGRWQVSLDVIDSQGNRFVDSQEFFVAPPQTPPRLDPPAGPS